MKARTKATPAKATPATVIPLVDALAAHPAEVTQPVNMPPADVIALVDSPVAEAVPAKAEKQKATLVLTGLGGTIRIDVKGATPAKAVRLKPVSKMPEGTALAGVEAEEGSALVRWVATPAVNNVRVEVEILL